MNPTTTQLLVIAAMIGAFWLLILKPQQQRQRQQKQMLSELKPGDEIVTIGGIYGTVVSVGERVVARTVGGTEFEVAPQAIANVVMPMNEDEDEVPDDTEDRTAESKTADDAEGPQADA